MLACAPSQPKILMNMAQHRPSRTTGRVYHQLPPPSSGPCPSAMLYFPWCTHSPSPCFATCFRGRTSTLRLSNARSSGVMTFSTSSGFFCPCLGDSCREALFPGDAGLPPSVDVPAAAGAVLGRSRGPGKLPFLSMVSTSRWKRRNSASARMRVDSRSMVPESSLTASGC